MNEEQRINTIMLAKNIIEILDTIEDGKDISPDWYAATKRIKSIAKAIVEDERDKFLQSV